MNDAQAGNASLELNIECKVVKVVTRVDGSVERYEADHNSPDLVIDQEACRDFLTKQLAQNAPEPFKE